MQENQVHTYTIWTGGDVNELAYKIAEATTILNITHITSKEEQGIYRIITKNAFTLEEGSEKVWSAKNKEREFIKVVPSSEENMIWLISKLTTKNCRYVSAKKDIISSIYSVECSSNKEIVDILKEFKEKNRGVFHQINITTAKCCIYSRNDLTNVESELKKKI